MFFETVFYRELVDLPVYRGKNFMKDKHSPFLRSKRQYSYWKRLNHGRERRLKPFTQGYVELLEERAAMKEYDSGKDREVAEGEALDEEGYSDPFFNHG